MVLVVVWSADAQSRWKFEMVSIDSSIGFIDVEEREERFWKQKVRSENSVAKENTRVG